MGAFLFTFGFRPYKRKTNICDIKMIKLDYLGFFMNVETAKDVLFTSFNLDEVGHNLYKLNEDFDKHVYYKIIDESDTTMDRVYFYDLNGNLLNSHFILYEGNSSIYYLERPIKKLTVTTDDVVYKYDKKKSGYCKISKSILNKVSFYKTYSKKYKQLVFISDKLYETLSLNDIEKYDLKVLDMLPLDILNNKIKKYEDILKILKEDKKTYETILENMEDKE